MSGPHQHPTAMSTLTLRITHKSDETADVCALDLASPDGAELPAFTAGAHLDLHLGGGLVRQYSLYGDPADRRRYRLAVLREPASRGGSLAVHALQAGLELVVSAPRNAFPLTASGPVLLLGGGIGLTPLLSMADALHAQGRPFQLHLCVRSRSRLPLAAHLAAVPWAAQVQVHADDEPATALDLPAVLAAVAPDTHVFTCGPAGFIAYARAAVQAAGWPDARWHSESFTPVAVRHSADGPFELELARSGRVIVVAADQTVAQALDAAGVGVSTSCEQGICGACITKVLSGTPDHRDSYLTDEELAAGDCFTPCVSRSRTARLVVDL